MSKNVSIGFRVEPTKVTYSIVEKKSDFEVLNSGKINIPKTLDIADQLAQLRSQVISVIADYGVRYVGIKTMESNAQTVNITRCYIEGVVIEALASSAIEKLFVGNMVQLAPVFNMKRQEIKKCIDGEDCFNIDAKWKNKIVRESILAAIASLKTFCNGK